MSQVLYCRADLVFEVSEILLCLAKLHVRDRSIWNAVLLALDQHSHLPDLLGVAVFSFDGIQRSKSSQLRKDTTDALHPPKSISTPNPKKLETRGALLSTRCLQKVPLCFARARPDRPPTLWAWHSDRQRAKGLQLLDTFAGLSQDDQNLSKM